jgi:hypothetical protein
MSEFYIHRKLHCSDQLIHDHNLLEKSGVFVVLAEPGAGKTDLLKYFSRCLSASPERAALFAHAPSATRQTLIVDALDEVARVNETTTNEIIVKARNSGAGTVIFASRSYVWDEARTQLVRDCFGLAPLILHLDPFDENEQRELFQHKVPGEDFEAFQRESERVGLTPLLGNPQFLQLFASAYVEGGRHFNSKRQIYSDAIRRLATESNPMAGTNRPPTEKLVAHAGEVFAKLLLSGASGVSAVEDIGDNDYPYLSSIGPDDDILTFVLNTRLFKPTTSVNRHEPVHRIVAEYCAADFLVRKIQNPTNTLSIKRCLAIIAPNGTVRTELRGMLGWMATLGGQAIQEAVLDIDPYAVFANGDASQLLPSSRKRLLTGLEALAKDDPYFRRMDAWRRFSVAGFFSRDIIEHVRPLITPDYANSHLRDLLLELLHGSQAALDLQPELQAILKDPSADVDAKLKTYQILDGLPNYDFRSDFDFLVGQASSDSLRTASEMVSKRGVNAFESHKIVGLLDALSKLYPDDRKRARIGSLYFIRRLIETFDVKNIVFFLEQITGSITCTCGKQPYECGCRLGVSKISGLLLDRYFETAVGPHDPRQISRWTRPLVFRNHIREENSASVQGLSSNHGLRRAIHIGAFEAVSTTGEIREVHVHFMMGHSHSGLALREGDVRVIVDHAVAKGSIRLWQHFIAGHNRYSEQKGVNELRAHMRAQARQSPSLLRAWADTDRSHRKMLRSQHIRFGRSGRRYRELEKRRREDAFAHLRQNRAQIEAGQHWGWLRVFAHHYLYKSEKIEEIVDDPQTLEKALLNCLDFLRPHVPSTEKLIQSRGTNVAMVLQAACLAIYRKHGSLDEIPRDTLRAIKVDGVGGSAYKDGEAENFESELDRLLFPTDADANELARNYIEPQLARSEESMAQVHLLDRGTAFAHLKGELSLEWLERFPAMPFSARDSLFSIAAVHADRARLNALIATRCTEAAGGSEAEQQTRRFWLLRHFFFVIPTSESLWAEFSADPQSIFPIAQCAGRFPYDHAKGWPQLGAEQVSRVLDAFVPVWPKVHLPDSYGTGDPEDERAYRFLRDVIYQIGRDDPANSVPVFDRILADDRFSNFHNDIKSERAAALRKLALSGFQPPRPSEVAKLLDESKIASVEDMRAVLVQLLEEFQKQLRGSATNPVDVFYSGDERVDENTARNRIVDRFEARLNAMSLGIVIEHQMANANRCDITASTSINGSQAVLVTEVKGQWNAELYTAASAQLADRYSIYPGAAEQGVYLVLWFGGNETIAGKRVPSIASAAELRKSIVSSMPKILQGRIDVFVLDVSRLQRATKTKPTKRRRRN